MKEVAKIKNYSVSEFWFKYYVFWKDENGNEYNDGWFETLQEAVDYIMNWVK